MSLCEWNTFFLSFQMYFTSCTSFIHLFPSMMNIRYDALNNLFGNYLLWQFNTNYCRSFPSADFYKLSAHFLFCSFQLRFFFGAMPHSNRSVFFVMLRRKPQQFFLPNSNLNPITKLSTYLYVIAFHSIKSYFFFVQTCK